MADDELDMELDRQVRMAAAVGGQLIERVARMKANKDRQEAKELNEDSLRTDRDAGRQVYANVRDGSWWDTQSEDQIKLRFGEAFTTARTMQDVDPVANLAARHLYDEAHRRYENADTWMAQAVESWAASQNGYEHAQAGTEAAENLNLREEVTLSSDEDERQEQKEGATRVEQGTAVLGENESAASKADELAAEADMLRDVAAGDVEEAERDRGDWFSQWMQSHYQRGEGDMAAEAGVSREVRAESYPRDAGEDLGQNMKQGRLSNRSQQRGIHTRRAHDRSRGR